ncbi:PHP domain-containing protein [Faecalibaculum rodentium]|uniref:PHP domain-containing protein n=1 Tax=Faecalibaculum rodentium TaxID=1702221 RepID=UPI0023F109A7|nr:PHP domain-containing protein [Faecalibaculum rodentium]
MRPDTDGHVHLENGPLSVDYVWEFVNAAADKGLKHLQILDHTHRFYEFAPMYRDVIEADPRQKAWFEKKQVNSIQDYIDLIEACRQEEFPIDVTFGLEVCWADFRKDFLKDRLSVYPWDFLVGSVHSVQGRLYDMDGWSREILWDVEPSEWIYRQYYDQLASAITSGLFTQIGHPDVVKMYQYDPGYDLQEEYDRISCLANEYSVMLEENTGASYRYGHPDAGLAPAFREAARRAEAKTITASDAHWPGHVGMNFDRLENR